MNRNMNEPSQWRVNIEPALPANEALIDEFVVQVEVAETTRLKYRPHLCEFERWLRHIHGSDMLLVAARTADVARFMAYLKSGNRFCSGWAFRDPIVPKPATRKNILASLASFYGYLVSIELVSADPTVRVEKPKVKHTPGLRLSAEQVRALLDARGNPRCDIQTYLLTFTGARSRELRLLQWSNVDFEKRTMMLHGKGDKHRVIDIHPRLIGELRRWYLYQEEQAKRYLKMMEAKYNPDRDFVLLTRNGLPVSHATICKQLKRRAARAGLFMQSTNDLENVSAITPHALRRTFGTILLNDGHHLDAVADVLGHASLDTTRKHYAFSSTERRRATIHGFKV